MSDSFRELLQKVGSGTHTSKSLSRQEAANATMMMLQQKATPAQIGAFMIAHRIKRPTPEELAGMLDAYDKLGAKLTTESNQEQAAIVLGNPYDGRSRTVPVTTITALLLAAVELPVVMHGGDCMPTKYGVPLVEIWQKLGVNLAQLSLSQAQAFFTRTKIGFIYLPQHFPLAYKLIPYREQIGKRPPFATTELIWCPVVGKITLVAGFVHPPTEERFLQVFKLRGIDNFTTVKGLEGSCDLPRSRTAIIGIGKPGQDFEHLFLHPQDYDLGGKDVALESSAQAIAQIQAVIQGNNCELLPAAILNGGFYLWRFGVCSSLAEGFSQAEKMIAQGQVAQKLQQLQNS